jgi:hypothetical protein
MPTDRLHSSATGEDLHMFATLSSSAPTTPFIGLGWIDASGGTPPYPLKIWDGAAWTALGVPGSVGPTGPTGPTGSAGAAGSAGAPGSVWYEGSGAPSSGTGVNGDYYLNTTNGDVYTKAAGAWGSPVGNLTGPTGSGGSSVTDATIATSDITTNNVSITKHGWTPKAPNDATKYLDGTGAYSVPAGGSSVTDATIATSDITTNNVSTSKHGWAPKAPADATQYLDGTGAWSVPAGGGGGSGAPTTAHYVTTQAEAGLSAESVLGADVLMSGAYGSLPSAAIAGRLYLPTDGPIVLRDTGSVWAPFGPIFPLTKPPAFSSWTWVNQGHATASDNGGGIYFVATGDAATSAMMLAKAVPATPYTVTFGILANLLGTGGNALLFVGFRNSTSGKLVLLEHYQTGNFIVENWNSATSYSGINLSARGLNPRTMYWLRLADDGTTRTYSFSADGINFITFGTDGHTNFLTPDQIVWGLNNPNTAGTVPMSISLISYKEA